MPSWVPYLWHIFLGNGALETHDVNKNIKKFQKGEENSKGQRCEQNLFKTLNDHHDDYVMVGFHNLELFLNDENDNVKHEEKDFLLIYPQLRLIIAIEAKFNLNKTNYKSAKKQLKSTKELLFRWFRGDLDSTWTLIPMIYCEQIDQGCVIDPEHRSFIIIGDIQYCNNILLNV